MIIMPFLLSTDNRYIKQLLHKLLQDIVCYCGGLIKKVGELWCVCCIIMFIWINKQPGIQKFNNSWLHYQYIYDWTSPFNLPQFLSWFITLQFMWGNECVNPVPCLFSLLRSSWWCFWSAIFFQGFIFTPHHRHWWHVGPCSPYFFNSNWKQF